MKNIVSEVGFEPTPPFGDQNAHSHASWEGMILESGALDRSAILTTLKDNVKVYLPISLLLYMHFLKFPKILF